MPALQQRYIISYWSCQFELYSVVSQHFYTLPCDRAINSHSRPSPCKLTPILLVIFSFTVFPRPSGNRPSCFCFSGAVLVLFCSFICFVLSLDSTYKGSDTVFLVLCLACFLRIILSLPLHAVASGKSSFSVIAAECLIHVCACACVCVCVSHLLYPFTSWWARGWLP